MSGSTHGLADPVVVNPLAAQTTALDAAGKVYDLRDKQATEAWGNALQQATDADGNVNIPLAQRLASQNPLARQGMMKNLRDSSALSTEQMNQGGAMYNHVARSAMTIMSDPSDGNLAMARDSMLRQFPGQAARINAEFDAAQRMDAAGRVRWAAQHGIGALDAATGMGRVAGQTSMHNFGGTDAPVTTQQGIPGYGAPQVHIGGGVAHTVAPETYYAPQKKQQGYNAQGQPVPEGDPSAVTFREAETPRGPAFGAPAPGTVSGAPGTGGAVGPPPVPPPPGTTPRGGAAGTGAPSAPAPVAAAKPPVVVTAPPAGVAEAQRKLAEDSAAAATTLTTRADQVPANKANYSNMMADLEAINSGPGTEREKNVNAFMQKWTGHGLTMTKEQVASAENYAKLANIAIGQQLAAIGGTDARQALFMGSNPNLELSKLGNKRILNLLHGNEDAIAAKSRAWQDWRSAGHGPDSYASFQNEFNKHFDPRVFQAVYMDPPEIAALRRSMKPEDQKKFLDDTDYARAQKWIP